MRKLREIASVYISAGKGSTPASIIQHGSLPNQRQITCEAKDLPHVALKSGISHPAIIVIGCVVNTANFENTADSFQYFEMPRSMNNCIG